MPNEDQIRGKSEKLKGEVKQAWADLTDDERLRREGEADELKGGLREAGGDIRHGVGKAVEELGEKIKR
jgi:uncharacterized protein YjbJ (UPF0337 family)